MPTYTSLRAVLSLSLLCALSDSALAQTREDPRAIADPSTFLTRALQDGMVEIELGKLAQMRGQTPEVKNFGALMVTDHSQSNAALLAAAKARGISVPARPDAEHQGVIDRFREEQGTRFDAAYIEHMVTDHARAIRLYTQASTNADKAIASVASAALPQLKAHKQAADRLAAHLVAPQAPSSHSTSER